jgi:hypothetical protein
MPTNDTARLDVAELERRLRAADPAVLLVRPRILRRVIKLDRKLTGIGLQVPHRKSYVIDRAALLRTVEVSELGLEPGRELSETIILLGRPEPEELAARPAGQVLVEYWRLLFHARVHVALEQRLAEGKLTEARINEHIHRMGRTEFDEIRTVLRQENFLLPPRDPRTIYIEFVACYLELRFFAAALLPRYFPTIRHFGTIDQMLAEDLTAGSLFTETRLEGAPDPEIVVDLPNGETRSAKVEEPSPSRPSFPGLYHPLMARAERAAALGNVVRAAVWKTRAANVAPAELEPQARAGAQAELDRLVDRLQAALGLSVAETAEWRQALAPLLAEAARRAWPAERRLLYDLQKVCEDHERQLYTVDLVRWALSLGGRPIKRPLPSQGVVLLLKHLRSAARRLQAVRLSEEERYRLNVLLWDAVHRSEERLRAHFRPIIQGALGDVDLRPQNVPQAIARHKLTEELLDRIGEHGFLNMGHLRDALSRNDLKLYDLAGPEELLTGDPLIRLNRRFAVVLDGVYHPGEIYLRGLQRLSSLAFGTRLGRFLTRYLALPFGGAFVILAGLQHIVGPLLQTVSEEEVPILTPLSFGILSIFLFALLHSATFRITVGKVLVAGFLAARGLVYDLPAAILRQPWVRRILASRPFVLMLQYILKPLLFAAPITGALWFMDVGAGSALPAGVAVFLVTGLLLNTRFGRDLDEAITDWLARSWYQIRSNILPGMFHLVMETFKRIVEAVERALYTVDEWLRFRSGEGRLSLVSKAVLGVIWFAATYIIRIYTNLLVEPTVNPIKHFPVVTVAAKLMIPLFVIVRPYLKAPPPLPGLWMLWAFLWITVLFIPGLAGFVVWELKENWRLYRANRPRTLRPVVIGHHGETMVRLLKPGFHSGTIPRLYAKLRRAERRAYRTGNWETSRKYRSTLYELEQSVRHLVEREFLMLLEESRCWGPARLRAGQIDLSSNRIRVELCCTELAEASTWIAFEELSGWLVAGVATPGWLHRLTTEQARALTAALAGLYKKSGVDLIRQQIEAGLGRAVRSYDIADAGIVVWPSDGYECEAIYRLRDGPRIEPRIIAGSRAMVLPALDSNRLLFRNVPIPWAYWVEVWARDQAGKEQPEPFLPGLCLLPNARDDLEE